MLVDDRQDSRASAGYVGEGSAVRGLMQRDIPRTALHYGYKHRWANLPAMAQGLAPRAKAAEWAKPVAAACDLTQASPLCLSVSHRL